MVIRLQRTMAQPRRGLRLVGAAILLVALVWTLVWQLIVVPTLHSSNHSSGPIGLADVIVYILGITPSPETVDQPDLQFIELSRDPCPAVGEELPQLSLLSLTIKALTWALPRNRWQKEMDACKCRPNPQVASSSPHNERSGVFDIRRFGAVGDGVKESAMALSLAFQSACGYSRRLGIPGTVLVPASCFFIKPVDFSGSCGPAGVRFKIEGTLIGPLEPSSYPAAEFTSTFFPFTNGLLTFRDFKGLIIEGPGVIEGQGFIFWQRFREKTLNLPIRPFAIRLMSCVDTHISGITLRNSPMYHVFAYNCRGLTVTGITTNSPGNTPNTDSLKLVGIQDCHISNSHLHGGDDDVSIVAVESLIARNVTVENVTASSGHGISIGSVGWNGTTACVSDILVRNVTLINLTHGVRIKSWRGGKGIVRNVRYENIHFQHIRRAIALNQKYCDQHQPWSCGSHPSNVAFYNISYSNLFGTVDTTKDPSGIQMNCSSTVPCTGISLKNIHLTPTSSSRFRLAAKLVPRFENVKRSVASHLEGLLPAVNEADGIPEWSGTGEVTTEQAHNIKETASSCGFQDFQWPQQ